MQTQGTISAAAAIAAKRILDLVAADTIRHGEGPEGARDIDPELLIEAAEALGECDRVEIEPEPHFVLTDAARDYLLRCEVEAETADRPRDSQDLALTMTAAEWAAGGAA